MCQSKLDLVKLAVVSKDVEKVSYDADVILQKIGQNFNGDNLFICLKDKTGQLK